MHRLALPFVLLLLLAGCLEFDGQEITIVHDAKADRIDVHVVCRGFRATREMSKRRDPVVEAAADLETMRRRGIVHLFGSWPLAFDPVKGDALFPELGGRVDVETGPLFTDAEELLCSQQFVRIRDARAFVDGVDAVIRKGLQERFATSEVQRDQLQLDDDSLRAIDAYCRSGERFVLVEPGRIELRLPLSDRDHVRLKEQLVGALAEDLAGELAARDAKGRREAVRRATVVRLLVSNEFSVVREPQLTRLAIGVKGADHLRLSKPLGSRRDPALRDHLIANGATLERLADDELERRFAAFRTRDAVLAPDLAAARAATAR